MPAIKKESFDTYFGTAAEKAAFASMALGDKYFETDTGKTFVYSGAAWVTDAEDVNSNSGKSSCSTTRPDDATPYAVNDVVGTADANMTFADILANAGQQFIVTGVTLETDAAAIPAGMGNFKLHLYDANPTVIADNAAYNLPAGDRAKYLGCIPIAMPVDLGDTLWSQNDNLNFNGKLAAGSTSLFGILTTDNVYTPSNLAVKEITLYTLGV